MLISRQTSVFCDLDLVIEVKSQFINVNFCPKNQIFLRPMEGCSQDLQGVIIVTGLRLVKFLVTLTLFSKSLYPYTLKVVGISLFQPLLKQRYTNNLSCVYVYGHVFRHLC